VVASRRDRPVALRPPQDAKRPAPDVERIVELVQYAERCEDGWRQWFSSTGIEPYEVLYEDLPQTGSGPRTECLGSSAFRNSIPMSFRPFATASRATL
jgi:hypothetical protein